MAQQSDKTFSLTNPMDMLVKLEWEWDKMRGFDITKYSHEKAYFALNAATTAWHISDWLAATLSEEQYLQLSTQAGTQIRDLKSLQNWAIRECNGVFVCDQVANGAKHFAIRPREEPVSAKEREFLLGELRTYYLMIEGGGNLISMDWIIGQAYAFWKEVFLACGIATPEQIDYPMVPRAWALQ